MSILKIDVDVKMSDELLAKFMETRYQLLLACHLTPIKINYKSTKHGFHAWYHLLQTLTDREMADTQFLMGDDQGRCRFNWLREEAGVFKVFNCLFSKKLKNQGVL